MVGERVSSRGAFFPIVVAAVAVSGRVAPIGAGAPRGCVVIVVIVVSRVSVHAWFQGERVAHLGRYGPVRILVVGRAVEGKEVFSPKRVVEESEGQRPEVTSYGSQVIEESIDLLKERLHTTMHCVE